MVRVMASSTNDSGRPAAKADTVEQLPRFEAPTIKDHGSIADHTYNRCENTEASGWAPPKDYRNFPLDKFGECSSGHAVS